jgi:hypothetical protein
MSVIKNYFVAQFFLLPTFVKTNNANLALKTQKNNKILGIVDSDPEQDPDRDAYLWQEDHDPWGTKTCASGGSGSGSATLLRTKGPGSGSGSFFLGTINIINLQDGNQREFSTIKFYCVSIFNQKSNEQNRVTQSPEKQDNSKTMQTVLVA